MSNRFIIQACCATLLGALSLGFLAGCADVVTYANDARKDGLKRQAEGNYVDAAGCFRNAVRQDPRDYKSYYYLGQCYDKMNSLNQATQAYRSGLDVMNITLDGKADRAFRLQIIDGLAGALAKGGGVTFDPGAVAGKSPAAEQKFITAKVYRNLGDADLALTNYQQANQLDPNDFAVAKEFGLYLVSTGQPESARPVLKRAYAMNSKDTEVANALRNMNVVPGPSLKEHNELVKPAVPQGPIPEANLGKMGTFLKVGSTSGDNSPAAAAGAGAAQPASGSVPASTPRD